MVQGTELLGTQDDGAYFWGHDKAFFRKSDLERIFRSISMPYRSDEKATRSDRDHDSTAVVSDAMDVLAMLQPSIISIGPSPDQLEPVARRLLGDGLDQLHYQLARDDLSLLLSLLMQFRLRKKKWGARLHFGAFEKADGSSEEMAATIVKRLGGDKDKGYLTAEEVQNAMSSLVSVNLLAYSRVTLLCENRAFNLCDYLTFHSPLCNHGSTSFGPSCFNHARNSMTRGRTTPVKSGSPTSNSTKPMIHPSLAMQIS